MSPPPNASVDDAAAKKVRKYVLVQWIRASEMEVPSGPLCEEDPRFCETAQSLRASLAEEGPDVHLDL